MGPVELHLRISCSYWPDWEYVVARSGTNPTARWVIYGASAYLNNGITLGMFALVKENLLPDVLTEAICASEALSL